jgi:uncharacterized membrane protein YdfJ with MMPL/SSD domain
LASGFKDLRDGSTYDLLIAGVGALCLSTSWGTELHWPVLTMAVIVLLAASSRHGRHRQRRDRRGVDEILCVAAGPGAVFAGASGRVGHR